MTRPAADATFRDVNSSTRVPPHGAPNDGAIRAAYASFIDLHLPTPRWLFAPAHLVVYGLCLLFLRIKAMRILRENDRHELFTMRCWQSFCKNAHPVTAHVGIANKILLLPGSTPSAALVFVSGDDRQAEYQHWLTLIESPLPGEADPSPPSLREYLDLLYADEGYQPGRRRRVPPELCNNLVIYACDLWINPALLETTCLLQNSIPCMSESGDNGRINLIPWWIVSGESPPPNSPKSTDDTQYFGVPFTPADFTQRVKMEESLEKLKGANT